jgi:hypothetical protein
MKQIENRQQRQLYFTIAWLLLLGYPPSVLAAEIWLGPMDVPVIKYLYVCWMATWGACGAFLQKYASGEIDKTWHNITLHATKDMVNSNLAAVLVFMACQHYGVPKAIEAICYTLGGYGGARTLEWMYARFIATGSGMITKVTGITDTPDTPTPAAPPSPPTGA